MGKYSNDVPKPYSAEYANDLDMRRHFTGLAMRYLSLIKLHRDNKHLPSLKNLSPDQIASNIESSGQKDWSGVVRHCLAEAGAVDALADLLDFSEQDRDNLIQAAILHDYDKRVEIQALRAAKENHSAVAEDMKEWNRKQLLEKGVKPEVVEIIAEIGDVDIGDKGGISLSQKILFYIDNITNGTNLVAVREKYEGLLKRYPKLAAEGAYDKWVQSTEDVQKEIADLIGLENPADLPAYILQKVKLLAVDNALKNYKRPKIEGEPNWNEGEVWERFSPDVKLMSETTVATGKRAEDIRETFNDAFVLVKTEDNVGKNVAYSTPADVSCEELIFSRVLNADPKARFLMEEKMLATGRDKKRIFNEYNYGKVLEGSVYIVDPIDGTSRYKNRSDEWSVVIGRMREGELVAGSIYAPKFGLLVTAEKNVGVMVQDEYPDERFGDIIIGCDLPELPAFKAFLDGLSKGKKQTKTTGSCALGFAMVAAGKADVIIQPNQYPWDFAAGAAIIKAAGGNVIYYHYRDNKIVRMDKPDEKTFNPKSRGTAVIASIGDQAEEYFEQLQSSWK